MSQYRTGTVTVTSASAVVTGSGTSWLTYVAVGDTFKIESENAIYNIASVDSDTQITLTTNYAGTTASSQSYQITVDFTPNLEIPEIWAGDLDWPYHLTNGLRLIDSLFAGVALSAKQVCRVATIANLDCTYSSTALTLTANANGAISIDGISLAANNRVLVKDQTSGTQNGIYYVSTVGTAGTPYVLTRATDFDSSSDIKAGVTTVVTEGTVNKDTGWMLTTNDTITLDTTSLTFEIFARAGTSAAGMTTATDPAENAACTTAIVDEYSGTIITTTTTGNSQTIQSPTDTRAGKIFTVVNNDTSTHSIPIVANSVTFTITAGEAQSFIWDGAQWGPTDMGITAIPVTVSQGGTGLATLTDHGILLGSGTGAVTPMSVGTNGQLVKGVSASDPIWSTTTLTDGTNTFNLTNGTASLDIAAGATLNIDKSLTVDGQATTITGAGQANTITLNESITIGDGYSGTLTYSAASKTLTVEADSIVNQDLTSDSTTAAFATADDNTATTRVATTAFAKSQDAVLAREPNQGVAMTYAASGSNGITVADNDNIDFGTGNFTLVWKGGLPDWTPSTALAIIRKIGGSPAYTGYTVILNTDGTFKIQLIENYGTGAYNELTTSANTFVDGTMHEIAIVIDRTNNLSYAYLDGKQLGSSMSLGGFAYNVSNSVTLNINGDELGMRSAGTVHHAYTFNRALTATEVLDLYRNGIAESDKWGSQTEQTSGTLTVGKRYRINNWITDDDFTNIGGTNEDGNEFVATGTTPTKWTNSSTVVEIGATLALEPEGINSDLWYDSSTNALNASYPVSGYSFTRSMEAITTSNLIAESNSLVIKPKTDATTAIQVADKDGNAILTVDTTNDRVGIGTTGPGAKLEVSGDVIIGKASQDNVLTIGGFDHGGTYKTYIDFQNEGCGVPGAWQTSSAGDKLILWGGTSPDLETRIGVSLTDALWVKSMGTTATNAFSVYGALANSGSANALLTIQKSGNVGIGTTSPTSTLHNAGSFASPITTKTADYTATASDHTILCNKSDGNITITLPAVSDCPGRIYNIKKIDSSAYTVTIDGNSSETIDGALTQTLTTQYESITIQTDGSAWYII